MKDCEHEETDSHDNGLICRTCQMVFEYCEPCSNCAEAPVYHVDPCVIEEKNLEAKS